MIMKAFGTLARVYNPGAELPLWKKLGPWMRLDRHVHHKLVPDEDSCFVHQDDEWTMYIWNSKDKSYNYDGHTEVDLWLCHPVEGQVEGQKFYTHYKYNMVQDQEG